MMLPTIFSLSALAAAAKINLQINESGDREFHQKLIYVDDAGYFNAVGQGKLFTGEIDNKGFFTGVDDTPGAVGNGYSTPALRLFSDRANTGEIFSVNGNTLSYMGTSEFIVCVDDNSRVWQTYLGGSCSNGHKVEINALDANVNKQ